MTKLQIFIAVLATLALAKESLSIPVLDGDIAFFDDEPSPVEVETNVTVGINGTDEEVSKSLGITQEFLQELKVNLEKAIQAEKQKEDRLRQEGFGGGQGGVGEFFGVGGGNNNNNGNNGQEEDEDEDEETGPTTQGPGAAGILTGLFGIFSGIGSLSPQRVIQSTVNFFPPDRRVLAQMALDSAFPSINNTTTLAPLTNAPSRRKTTVKPMTLLAKANSNSTDTNSTSAGATPTPWPKIKAATTETAIVAIAQTTPRKKLVLKETSLLEDFEEAVDVFQPSISSDKNQPNNPNVISSLEKDFADTAEKFKIESLLSSEVEKEREREKQSEKAKNPITKDFLDTVLLF